MGRKADLPGRRQATYRTGIGDFPGFGGMLLEGDSGSNPPNRPAHLENVTFRGGNLKRRSAAVPLWTEDNPLDAANASIIVQDFQTKSKKIFMVADGCPSTSETAGLSLDWFDHEQEPSYSSGNWYDTATQGVVIGKFSGNLYVAVDNKIHQFIIIVPPYGEGSLSVSGKKQDIPLYTFSGFTKITCMQEFDGKLFIGLDNGAGASAIWSYDGISFQADLTAINAPSCMGRFRDKLAVGFDAGTLKLRSAGASPGSYSTIVEAAGTMTAKVFVEYKDNLYATSGDRKVWEYDGATLSAVHTLPVGTASSWGLASAFGYLYYGFTNAAGLAALGQYDGTTWTDAHKVFTEVANTILPKQLVEYRGDMFAGVTTLALGFYMFESPGSETDAASWQEQINTAVLGGEFPDVDQLLVF